MTHSGIFLYFRVTTEITEQDSDWSRCTGRESADVYRAGRWTRLAFSVYYWEYLVISTLFRENHAHRNCKVDFIYTASIISLHASELHSFLISKHNIICHLCETPCKKLSHCKRWCQAMRSTDDQEVCSGMGNTKAGMGYCTSQLPSFITLFRRITEYVTPVIVIHINIKPKGKSFCPEQTWFSTVLDITNPTPWHSYWLLSSNKCKNVHARPNTDPIDFFFQSLKPWRQYCFFPAWQEKASNTDKMVAVHLSEQSELNSCIYSIPLKYNSED